MNTHKCPLVMIEWLDSAQPTANWSYLQTYEPRAAVQCVSVGWLIHDGDVKALAQNFGDVIDADSAQVSGVIHIPARCVTRTTYLDETGVTSPSFHPG